jgi:hypothetical protein
MPNAAIPELFPEHGRKTLNTAHKQNIIHLINESHGAQPFFRSY